MFSNDRSMEYVRTLTAEHWICLAGLILLAYWLLRTSLGVKALAGSMPRRNSMPVYLPLIPLFIWFGPVPMAILVAQELTGDSSRKGYLTMPADWQSAFLNNCIFIVGGIVTTAVILLLARAHFARRLRGFGLNIKTVPADFLGALVNLLAVWPLIMAAIVITLFFAQHIWGQDYQMQRHQELKLITEYPQLLLRITIVVVAAVIAPLLEELLFRGLVQTMIRSLLQNSVRGHVTGPAWLAIAASSGLFTLMHANAGHWPALFVLGACMGYAYEKSGSLFRPIFIHALFNTASIAAALSQS
ncbi:MAG TPA: CPBP family intramembrane glutamic endopeptidase [Sedimentisphaerales bacterium]|nr:CPBP family intramembrane glutamic endopeptidase [Sedimentisphaerales bacterium]